MSASSSTTTGAAPSGPPLGLRDRKRARVRQELIDAAMSLFAERGFDAVTVDEIAEAADVAPRTFYRYFPAKEDVVTADGREATALMIETLAARPPEEPPLVALREAMRPPTDLMEKSPRLCAGMQMMGSSTSLLANGMVTRAQAVDEVTRLLRERIGADEADIRPRVIAACVMASVSVAFDGWIAEGAKGDDLEPRLDEVMALLREGFEVEAPTPRPGG